jgi:hypothetical protein
MADLILQDFRDFSGMNLAQFLSIEKKEMLGEETLRIKQTTVNRFRITRSFTRAEEDQPAQ